MPPEMLAIREKQILAAMARRPAHAVCVARKYSRLRGGLMLPDSTILQVSLEKRSLVNARRNRCRAHEILFTLFIPICVSAIDTAHSDLGGVSQHQAIYQWNVVNSRHGILFGQVRLRQTAYSIN